MNDDEQGDGGSLEQRPNDPSTHPTPREAHRPSVNDDDHNDRSQAKRRAARILKAQARIRTLETRLKRCAVRRDPAELRARTESELVAILQTAREELQFRVVPELAYVGRPVAMRIVESIYEELRRRCLAGGAAEGDCDGSDEANTAVDVTDDAEGASALEAFGTLPTRNQQKARRNERARQLLKSMTKGTQTRSMFDDPDALAGYTRHKFVPRAVLVVDSLGKVMVPASRAADAPGEDLLHRADRFELLQRRLLSVRTVCSIGCGPACEVVGLIAFLRSLTTQGACSEDTALRVGHGTPVSRALENVVLLDWAMDQWKPLLLDDLYEHLVPQYARAVAMEICDVSHSLYHPDLNRGARAALHAYSDHSTPDALDLVIVSYLLTETRDRWQPLLDDMVPFTSMFLLSDPTAWQLHAFCRRYAGVMEFVWLDSSMHYPQLQLLEGRVGPAVVLALRI